MKSYFAIFLCLLCSGKAYLQHERIEVDNETIVVRISEKERVEKDIRFRLPLLNTNKQNLVSWSTTVSLDSFMVDEANSKVTIIVPMLKKNDRFKLYLNTVLYVRPSFYDDFEKYNYPEDVSIDTSNYLSVVKLSVKETTKLQKITDLLVEKDRHSTISAIIKYIHRSHKLDNRLLKINKNIEKTLKSKYLSIWETNNLMLAMCRVAKIPSRIVYGHIVKKDQSKAFSHYHWVEAFIPGKGWVNYDPYFSGFKNNHVGISSSSYQYIIYTYLDHFIRPFEDLKDEKLYFGVLENLSFKNINNMYIENGSKYYFYHKNNEAVLRFDSVLAINPFDHRALLFKAVAEAREQKFEHGIKYLQLALKFANTETEKSSVLYGFANYFALKREKENFLTFLEAAIEKGFQKYDEILYDTDLAFYREDTDFLKTIKTLKSSKKQNKVN